MAQISDAKALRALAHPLRIRLLQELGLRGSATATELADAVDESPANCSFHLRKLAEFGYIERAGRPGGRERPWRVADPDQTLVPAPDDQEAQQASAAARAALLDHAVARIVGLTGRRVPEQWRGVSFQNTATLFLTPDEVGRLRSAIAELVAPYVGRITDPGARPAGAAPVQVLTAATYLSEPSS